MADKYGTMFGDGSRKGTRKGVKANHAGEKLVNVTDGVDVKRVRRSVALAMVNTGSWRYCPKKFKP